MHITNCLVLLLKASVSDIAINFGPFGDE